MKTVRGLGAAGVALFICAASVGVSNGQAVQRNFVLLFDILDYTPEMGKAVAFFYNDVLAPDDQLIIYSPARAYGFSKNTLAKPKRELIAAMQENLRKDAAACGQNVHNIFNEMSVQARAIEGVSGTAGDALISLKNSLAMYRQDVNNLDSLRKVDESLLEKIVEMFKVQPGQNHMIMIYQAEFRPIPNKETVTRLRSVPEIAFQVSELFASDDQKAPLNASRFIDVFNSGRVILHFLYIKPKDKSSVQDFKEHSADMFDVFSMIAKATGGIVETTANPEAALKSVVRQMGKTSSGETRYGKLDP